MFTGIVTELGRVTRIADHALDVHAPHCSREIDGASVAVNGTCLTISRRDGEVIGFDLLPDTLMRTNLGQLEVGSVVNLEPALRAGDPFGGHIVQGHVDAIGTVRSVTGDDTALDVWLDVPVVVLRYCVIRGSVTVNGVSLTIMELDATGVRLALIPETRTRTNLGSLAPGDSINLEADVLARYVERLIAIDFTR